MTRLGESAFTLRDLEEPAWRLADRIMAARLPGVIEACPAYETVGLYVDPESFAPIDWSSLPDAPSRSAKELRIPVCYAYGEDLEEAADRLGLTPEAVIAAHTSVVYDCAAVGFCPGFPYLRSLPSEIAGLPRKSTPRLRVEPGSVAITGEQTGVYPLERPGGRWILGRTPLTLVDESADYFPIQPGDRIRFTAIDVAKFDRLRGERL